MSNTVNAINPRIDRTVQIFDKFYDYSQAISGPEYDAVYSYLRSVFNTTAQAENFTTTLFRIANTTGQPAITLLQDIQGASAPQVTLVFAYYLNTFQSPATQMGVQIPRTPNYYVAHNIRQ